MPQVMRGLVSFKESTRNFAGAWEDLRSGQKLADRHHKKPRCQLRVIALHVPRTQLNETLNTHCATMRRCALKMPKLLA